MHFDEPVLAKFGMELTPKKRHGFFELDIISLYSIERKLLNIGAWIHHLKKVTKNLRVRIISNDSESQTAISGLGRRVGQLDAGQTENAEYQGTKPDQSPHIRLAS
ncbi:hypothetical protein BB560_004995 [Smittium megazygosporum]|uniref:Uncharacterized protein n=1 Tax=Smittium megazygosporum TaxID=133381 RepID=A0A2T9Z7W1_9FUNG|nr:hypothetical protein BB560_004995 [Smittium megazygosporum]